jgi:hypothetical protein
VGQLERHLRPAELGVDLGRKRQRLSAPLELRQQAIGIDGEGSSSAAGETLVYELSLPA